MKLTDEMMKEIDEIVSKNSTEEAIIKFVKKEVEACDNEVKKLQEELKKIEQEKGDILRNRIHFSLQVGKNDLLSKLVYLINRAKDRDNVIEEMKISAEECEDMMGEQIEYNLE